MAGLFGRLAGVEELFLDSSVARAHPHAAGTPKKRGQEAQALGRRRSGFGTKIHLAADDEKTALGVILTPRFQAVRSVTISLLFAAGEREPCRPFAFDR